MFVIVMKNIEELSEISLKLSSPQIKSSLSVGHYRVDTLKTMEWPAAMISHDEEQGEATCNSTKYFRDILSHEERQLRTVLNVISPT